VIPAVVSRLLSAADAHSDGRRQEWPETISLNGNGPLASDYVAEGRR
jgi:hypothetical protein